MNPQFEVIRVRGPVCWIQHQRTGKVRSVNRNKLLLVDPNMAWDEVATRPHRNPRQGVNFRVAPERDVCPPNIGVPRPAQRSTGDPNRRLDQREETDMDVDNSEQPAPAILGNGQTTANSSGIPPAISSETHSTHVPPTIHSPPVPTHRYFTRSKGRMSDESTTEPSSPSPPPPSVPIKRRATECFPNTGDQKRQRLAAIELASFMCL